ncbi:MAG: LPS export ABC transporter permease LptF [Deltaproteobacteria bacterium]|nr:LPS export ABC transporter permease LptF [Deltaproteobacteria bacterium]
MRINTISNRYLFKEMVPPFIITLLFFTFVFLMAKILEIADFIINYRIRLSTVLWMLVYSIPYFLEFVIPMGIMMGVLLAFLRLSKDNEIVAFKAGGMSIYGLLPPVVLFCFMGCLLTGFMAIHGMPWGRASFQELAFQVAASHLNVGLKERTFNDRFKDVMLYINKIDLKNNTLVDVFIEDQRNKKMVSTIMAPRGKLSSSPDKLMFHLRLQDGTIIQVNPDKRAAHAIHFSTYDVSLDFKKAIFSARGGPKDEKEMSLTELRQYIHDAKKKDAQYYVTLMEFHKKFSIPFACLSLGLLAVPLGVHSRSVKRSAGLGLGLLFFLFYYFLLSAGLVFGEAGVYPPIVGMWVPNIVTGGIGLFLLVRTARERPSGIALFHDFMQKKLARLTGKDEPG